MARDFLKADAKIFWAQLGLESLEAEEILRAGGCDDIVMNRCIKREHTRLIEKITRHIRQKLAATVNIDNIYRKRNLC